MTWKSEHNKYQIQRRSTRSLPKLASHGYRWMETVVPFDSASKNPIKTLQISKEEESSRNEEGD